MPRLPNGQEADHLPLGAVLAVPFDWCDGTRGWVACDGYDGTPDLRGQRGGLGPGTVWAAWMPGLSTFPAETVRVDMPADPDEQPFWVMLLTVAVAAVTAGAILLIVGLGVAAVIKSLWRVVFG